jgi:hypothetical protein
MRQVFYQVIESQRISSLRQAALRKSSLIWTLGHDQSESAHVFARHQRHREVSQNLCRLRFSSTFVQNSGTLRFLGTGLLDFNSGTSRVPNEFLNNLMLGEGSNRNAHHADAQHRHSHPSSSLKKILKSFGIGSHTLDVYLLLPMLSTDFL